MNKSALLEQHTASEKKIAKIDLATIQTRGLQTRESTDRAKVVEYTERYRAGLFMPPIVVFSDGGDEFYLADGHHRLAAAAKADLAEIEAIIKKGDRRAAIWYATAANVEHGLPRTNDDKRKTVALILADEEWRALSDAAIAEHASVSDRLVAKVRKEVGAEVAATRGKDGKVRARPAKGDGKIDADKTVAYLQGVVARLVATPPTSTWNEYDTCTNPVRVKICKRDDCELQLLIAKDGDTWSAGYTFRTKTSGGGGSPQRGERAQHTSPQLPMAIGAVLAGASCKTWPKDVDTFLTATLAAFPAPPPGRPRISCRTAGHELQGDFRRIVQCLASQQDKDGAPLTDTDISQRLHLGIGLVMSLLTSLCDDQLVEVVVGARWTYIVTAAGRAAIGLPPITGETAPTTGENAPAAAPSPAPPPEPGAPAGPEDLSIGDIAPAGVAIEAPSEPPPPSQPPRAEDLFADQAAAGAADPHRANLRPLGLRRIDKQREILQHKLLRGKTTWTGTDGELLTLALLAGVPTRKVAWIDPIKAQARDLFIDALRAEVADRVRTGEAMNARAWPQLAEICRLFDLDHQAIEIEAERAVPE